MQISVQNSQVEGEHQLKYVRCIKFSYERLLILILLCIFSGFLVGLYFRWFPQKLIDFLYISANSENSTHIKTFPYGEVCPIIRKGDKIQFLFRFLKYEMCGQVFLALEYKSTHQNPLSKEEVKEMHENFGNALMKIPITGFLEFMLEELSTPFYILQYVCVGVWLIQGFVLFAIVMMSFSLLSTLIQFILLRKSLNRLQSLAAINQNVTVYRDDKRYVIDCDSLVPGDIFELDKMTVPADCILNGMVLVNEATLTGESNPVPKQSGLILFEGTKILECNSGSTAQVIRTNYSTIRGQYFRNVIYPENVTHKFYTQAMKFLFWFVIFNVMIIIATIQIYLDYATELIVASVLATLTWILPPAMPIFFSLTATIALLKLKKKNVIGSDMDKIHISGQINVVCFDKTGTLTTNELTVVALWSKMDCSICISCCHHIYLSEGELVGDILDLEMFKFSQSYIQFNQEETIVTNRDNKQYKVIKIFDFNQELMMMSVIVEYESKFYFCSKGAPDKIQHKIVNLTEEIVNQLSYYVNSGFRVISLVQKEITIEELNLPREQLETNLEFLGYLVFENCLKNDTISVIQHLVKSNLKVKILSGDNPLTTINTAYNIGIAYDIVKLFDIKQEQIKEVEIHKVDGKQIIKEEKLYLIDGQEFINYTNKLDCQFALTGSFMEYCNQNQLDVSNLYQKTVVFARVKPHQKKEVIFVHQQQKNCVAMIGDGSNDCSAISQADIGISFSSTDASYTANFSSLDQSIQCVVTILSQGRATAQILTELFPLFTLLSFLQTILYTFQAIEVQDNSDIEEIFESFGCYLLIMAAMTLSDALPYLSKELPLDDLYARNNQLSFYAHLIIFTGGIVVTFTLVLNSDGHKFNYPDTPIEEYITEGMLNTTSIIIHELYCQILPLLYFVSKPFKEPFYKNYIFTGLILISITLTMIFIFYNPSHSFLGLVDLNSEIEHFDMYLLLIVAGTVILDIIIQYLLEIKFPKKRLL